jgi:hypothetical protein
MCTDRTSLIVVDFKFYKGEARETYLYVVVLAKRGDYPYILSIDHIAFLFKPAPTGTGAKAKEEERRARMR